MASIVTLSRGWMIRCIVLTDHAVLQQNLPSATLYQQATDWAPLADGISAHEPNQIIRMHVNIVDQYAGI